MQAGRHMGIANVNDQITQSQSVGLLPMLRSGSRLDPINETSNANPIMHDVIAPAISNLGGAGNQNFNNKNNLNNRAVLGGRGLGGVGGSIISSSGIN